MPAAIAGAVLAITGSTAVAAVAGAVIQGAIIGAVVGAATSLITGGNILKGALMGALVGGIGGGLISGLGMATNISSAANQLSNLGVGIESTASSAMGPVENTVTDFSFGSSGPDLGTFGAGVTPTVPVVPKETTGFLSGMSDDTKGKLLAGVGEGAAKGAGSYLAAKETGESEMGLLEYQRENYLEDKASNMPGDFEARVANIQIPDWWAQRVEPLFAAA